MSDWNWGDDPGRNRHVVKLLEAQGHDFDPAKVAQHMTEAGTPMTERAVKMVHAKWDKAGRPKPFIPRVEKG